jgi:pseudaminic acid biosynthesis-associated methylase
MVDLTPQMKSWMGKFGAEYTDRNTLSLDELDKLYLNNYGISRNTLNNEFLKDIIINSARVLEVGSNIGNQLLMLQKMGFNNLYGIELQRYAIKIAQQRAQNIHFCQGSVYDMPFKDNFFDLVFTSGLLIHINPINIKIALKEIYRCTNNYIWGFEYWSDNYTEVRYRGNKEMLWKTDFGKLYLETFDDLIMVKHNKIKYVDDNNIDLMFLLKKMK